MNSDEKFTLAAGLTALGIALVAVLLQLGILALVLVILMKLAFGWFGGF